MSPKSITPSTIRPVLNQEIGYDGGPFAHRFLQHNRRPRAPPMMLEEVRPPVQMHQGGLEALRARGEQMIRSSIGLPPPGEAAA